MTKKKSVVTHLAGAMLCVMFMLCTAGENALSAGYPSKPVRVVVPYPPGGTTDIVGRLMAQELGKSLGQTFVVDNRGGASGQIGTDIVAKAAADGYTLIVGASGNIMMQSALSLTVPYHVAKDFAPIANLATVSNLMVVNPSSGFTSLRNFIDYAKKHPGKIRYASGGTGSSGHIAGALLSATAGIDMLHVPYRGGGLSVISVISGETDVNFLNLPTALPHTRSGKLRGLAVLSTKRAAAAPEFPTTVELGMPRVVITSSTGLLAPSGTPKRILRLLESELKRMADDRAISKQITDLGADVDYMDAFSYGKYIGSEISKYADVGKRAHIVLH